MRLFQIRFIDHQKRVRYCNWPSVRSDGQSEWRMSTYYGMEAWTFGGLDTEGFEEVIHRFALERIRDDFAPADLRFMSPFNLLRKRRELERYWNDLSVLNPLNDHNGQFLEYRPR